MSGRVGRFTHTHEMNVLDVLAEAEVGFVDRVALVRPEHLGLPTPCRTWDVGDVVRHVLGGALGYVQLLRGADASTVASMGRAVVLEAKLTEQARGTATELARAFAEPGAMQRSVSHAIGQLPAEALLGMRVVECVVHGWDLTRALGVPDEVDEALSKTLLDRFGPVASGLASTGLFAPPVRPQSSTRPSTQMLAMFGRSATSSMAAS